MQASGIVVGGISMLRSVAQCNVVYCARALQVMAIGTAGWVLAALSVSISSNYLWLLCSRVMVGIGEASFTGLAPSSIDNVAPPASKTLWLGLFFAAIPVGQALGIATGGVIAELGPLSIFGWKMSGWRLVFFLEAMVMLPLSCLCWVLPKQVWPHPTCCVIPGGTAWTCNQYTLPPYPTPHPHTLFLPPSLILAAAPVGKPSCYPSAQSRLLSLCAAPSSCP